MENTETPIQTEQTTTTTTTTTIVTEPEVTETTPVTTAESTSTTTTEETPVTETTEEVVVPETKTAVEEETTTTTTPTTTETTDEQENVTDANSTVPPTSLSPGRPNVPLKEVNESEKEETPVVPNGTENGLSKKRELEQEDEPTEETTNGNEDQQRNSVDQTKKIKVSENNDTPIMESKEVENNLVVNGNNATAVEV